MNLRSLRETVGDTLYRQVGRARSHVQEHRSLPVDVLESEDSYLVVFDAAGAEPGDLQVRYIDGTVKVRVDRFRSYHDGFEMRFPGRGTTLEGETALPDDALVNPDAGTATLTDVGTIQITIPKEGSVDTEAGAESATAAEERALESNPDAMAPSDPKPGTEPVVVDD